MHTEDVVQNHSGSIIAASVSVSPYEACLVNYVGHAFSGPYNPFSPYSMEFSEFVQMFGCGSLPLFPSSVKSLQ